MRMNTFVNSKRARQLQRKSDFSEKVMRMSERAHLFIYTHTHTKKNVFRRRSRCGVSGVSRSPTLPPFVFLLFSHFFFPLRIKGTRNDGEQKKKCEGWNTLYRCSSHLSVCLLLLRAPLSSKVGGTTTRLKTTLFFFLLYCGG